MARENEGKVVFFGVAWRATEDECRDYMKHFDVPYQAGLDEREAVFRAYRVPYQPETFLITRSGRIFDRIAGQITRERLSRRASELLSEV